jgi:hypothetical protein
MNSGIHILIVLTVIASVLLVSSCGDGDTPGEPLGEGNTDTLSLAVVDTIGIEMGDSLYVFGSLMQAGFLPGGEILALDLQRGYINVYAPDGSHIGAVGAHGPGPGEFEIPTSFAVLPDGGIAVTDIVGRDISFFDPARSYTRVLSGFSFGPPMNIRGCPDGALVGQTMTMTFTEETVEGSQDLARWDDLTSTEPSLIYASFPIDLNITGDQGTEVRAGPTIDFAVGPDGSIAIVETSDTLFSLKLLDPEGTELMSLYEERERVPMTQEEIDAGALGLSVMITDGSASASTSRIEDIYPYRNIIQSVGIDAEERIWVELGYGDKPFFQVFDYSGAILFTATVDTDFNNINRPSFVISSAGMLAFDSDPLDYPKIYLLTPVE